MNRIHAMLSLCVLLLVGCQIGKGNSNTPECTDHGQCGELQACLNEECTDVDCISSSDCPLHNYCKTEESRFECVGGCESDDDCIAGEQCHADYGTCEEYGCRSTDLDCPVGSTCDESTGDCVAADGLCQRSCDVYAASNCGAGNSCQVADWGDECERAQDCEQGYACDMFLASDDECWENSDCPTAGAECYGAIPGLLPGQCVISYCHTDYCMPNCNLNAPDCPAGFSCEDGGDGGVCWGACVWYTENGYL